MLLLETMLAFEDKDALVREIAAALPPGGRFAFTLEEGSPLTAAERAAMPDADTVWLTPLDELAASLERAGLVVTWQEDHSRAHRATAQALADAFAADAEDIAAQIGRHALDELLAAHRLWIDWLDAGRVRKLALVAQLTGLRHRSSFGAAAVAYAEHRPDYAQAAVRWALEPAPGPRVLDLGAGTGKLTATLVALGGEVVCGRARPGDADRAASRAAGVRALPGSAEAIPLPDASVDAVLAGNAMHWFDMAVAGPEIARVLAPGGVLAGLWNVMDDRVDWVAGLAQVSGSAAIGPRDTPTSWRAETADLHLPKSGAAARFGSPEQAEFPHGQRRTADSLVATLATRAGMLVMPDQEREATLGRIRAFLASRPETARGEFTLPMLTGVLRVRRR